MQWRDLNGMGDKNRWYIWMNRMKEIGRLLVVELRE